MTITERKELCRLILMMNRQKEYSKKIGLEDRSILRNSNKEKNDNIKQ